MATTSSRAPAATISTPHNLPLALKSLVGRGSELDRIARALRRTRLMTVTGPIGVGKTEVALEVARRQVARHAHGAWLVDLVSVSDPAELGSEVARILGVRAPHGTPPAGALQAYLLARDVLLVLDNCDQVVEGCAELAAGLLSACRDVRILATSREPLGLGGETVWRLEPLPPEDARRLFVARARQREPDFVTDEPGDRVVEMLCERLDHLPFAIELAAGTVSLMSPEELLADLEERLDVLGEGRRLTPPHHRTVRAALDWSLQLLEAHEREALRALAVFVGGFDAEAAAAVAPGLRLDVLGRLVDKSLVSVTRTGGGRTRYRLLETVRRHLLERLVEAGELDAARRRHLRHFSALAAIAREEWASTGAQRFVNAMDEDYENVRAALEWAVGADPCAAMPLLGGTRDLFFRFGQADGLRLARIALERCDDEDPHKAEAYLAAGQLAATIGDFAGARALLSDARRLSVELGERRLEAWARFFLGLTCMLGGELEPARGHLHASRALHRELQIATGEARSIAVLGMTFVLGGEPAAGGELLETALSLYTVQGDSWGRGQCHTFLGMAAEATGADASRVSRHYRTAVDLLRPSRDATLLPLALMGQAAVVAHRDPALALRIAAAAVALRAHVGGGLAPFVEHRLARIRSTADAALGAAAERAWAEGSRLTLDEAVSLAFGAPKRRPASQAGLSARELEVAGMVAEGLPNKAIAARLHLSVRTVESHVRHALAKAGLENRTQLATWIRGRAQ